MKIHWMLVGLLLALALDLSAAAKTRLFIMSGQSNMAKLDPELSFRTTLEKAFPGDEILIVKHAKGGEPIRRWYLQWKLAGIDDGPKKIGNHYRTLMAQVDAAVAGKQLATVTFCWMQGEADGKSVDLAGLYAESLKGVIAQVRAHMKRKDVTAVIGRINLFGVNDPKRPGWKMVREAQVAVAEGDPLAAWVDLDDLGKGLHYSDAQYGVMGERFATAAIGLIRRGK